MNKDLIRLKHMLDSAKAIVSFVEGRSRLDLDSDRQLLSAIIRELEILGEAANHVSKDTQSQIKQIPWEKIIGMRNRLIHAYFDVNRSVVWSTVQNVLPAFCLTLERSIQPEFKILKHHNK